MRTDKIDRFIILICGFFLTVPLGGCAGNLFSAKEKIETENVMSKGDRIIAVTHTGTLTITAGENNKRYLTVSGEEKGLESSSAWLGDTVCVKLKESEKRYRGLYCDTNTKKIRNKISGGEPTNVKMVEAQLHFDTLEAAKEWVRMAKKEFDERLSPHAWSSDGLYVRFDAVRPEYYFFPSKLIYMLRYSKYT